MKGERSSRKEPAAGAPPGEGKSQVYRVDLRRKPQRALDRLPDNDFDAVVKAVRELANSPRPKGVEKIKTAGLWRVRQGDYRVVYDIDDKQKVITVVRIGRTTTLLASR